MWYHFVELLLIRCHRSDIAFLLEVDEILDALKETWAIPLAHGSKVLAVTLPGATVDGRNQTLVTRRNDLNQKIKAFTADGLYERWTPSQTPHHHCT